MENGSAIVRDALVAMFLAAMLLAASPWRPQPYHGFADKSAKLGFKSSLVNIERGPAIFIDS
jgi:hypothetical protein